MIARYFTSNRSGDYFTVDTNPPTSVKHRVEAGPAFVCLGCAKNDCEHIEAVEALILAGGGPATEQVA